MATESAPAEAASDDFPIAYALEFYATGLASQEREQRLESLKGLRGDWTRLRSKYPADLAGYVDAQLEEVAGLVNQQAPNSVHQAADKLRNAAGRLRVSDPKPARGASKSKRKAGRPSDTNLDEDKRVYEAWQTGSHTTKTELAAALGDGWTLKKVETAIDRHRKRVERANLPSDK